MKTLRDGLIILIAFGGLWAFFVYVPIFNSDSEILSAEKESDLGEKLTEMASEEYDLSRYSGTLADSALKQVSNRLLDSMGLSEFDYTFYLVRNDQVNAFALPGANIIVYSGLVKFVASPEELASVLAHEIGHVEKRHVVDRLLAEFGITLLFSVLSGGDAMVIDELVQSLISNGFSRQQEGEADEFSLDLLEKSNINPQSMGTFFRRLKMEEEDWDPKLELLLSHPNLNSRIKASLEYQVKEDFQAQPFGMDWEAVRELN